MNPSQTTLDRARALRQQTRARTFQREQEAPESPFPVVLRGYDRAAVDEYIAEVNRLIGELRTARSPQAAVREALDRVGEETSSILQRAHETAEEITGEASAEARHHLDAARQDAESLRREAESHARTLAHDSDSVWQERGALLDDMRRLADSLLEVADSASERIPQSPATAVREAAETARAKAEAPAEPEEDDGAAAPMGAHENGFGDDGRIPDDEPRVWREPADVDGPTRQMSALSEHEEDGDELAEDDLPLDPPEAPFELRNRRGPFHQ